MHKQTTLLIVDDLEPNRLVMKARLGNNGYDFLMAKGGQEAIDLLESGADVDLVLLDIMMPDINGIEVLKRINANDKLRDIPVMMITAMDEDASLPTCLELGASDYVSKTAKAPILKARVATQLSRKKALDAAHVTRRNLRHKIEQHTRALQQAEAQVQRLTQTIEQAGESILITDRDGMIEYINPAFSKLTGYSREEIIGQTPGMLKSGNQDAALYETMWKTVTAGKLWHGKVINRKKDGSLYPAMLTISPIYDRSGDTAGDTTSDTTSDATSYSHFVAIQTDLSDFEQAEQARRMASIATLVGGIAHEFNNMLAGITGNVFMLRLRTRNIPDVAQQLDHIESISFRAADMIEQLLTFARKDVASMQPLAFNAFITETLKSLSLSLHENISMHEDICLQPLLVNGDGAKLYQVLLHLIHNARDALEGVEAPCITVGLESWLADAAFIEKHPYVKVGAYAHLSVTDNGSGIPAHQKEKLFEPFFTTREVGKGIGLGLSMVFGAVKTHGGFVEVDSAEGAGSTFHLYLPLLEVEEQAVVSTPQHVAEGHGETILLVDDERQIIETGKEVLELLGYQVLTAANGQQAVEIFQARSDEIDLCILDVVMPGISGTEAAQRMRRINPQVKIIFSTGYDKRLLTGMEHEVVLSKPFPIEEMSQLIHRQLAL